MQFLSDDTFGDDVVFFYDEIAVHLYTAASFCGGVNKDGFSFSSQCIDDCPRIGNRGADIAPGTAAHLEGPYGMSGGYGIEPGIDNT